MELSESDKDDLRLILEDWYGAATVSQWRMSAALLEILEEAITGLEVCSKAMNFVPRPMARPDGYVRRQLANIARRARNSDAQYLVCRDAARHRYRSRFELTGRGL
jgi:hypothetical protein